MKLKLRDLPGWESIALDGIDIVVERPSSSTLRLRYVARGRIGQLLMPDPGPPVRRNNLWQTTCFEAFLKPEGGQAYLEFNFSPSTAWAAYHFSAYRAGMAQATLTAPPEIVVTRGDDRLQLDVALSLDLSHHAYRMGLSAVIDEGSIKSHWALGHPSGSPDFHHPACFAADLPPAPHP